MVARPGTRGPNETVWKRRRRPSRVEDATLGQGATRPDLRIAAAILSRGHNLCSQDDSPLESGRVMRVRQRLNWLSAVLTIMYASLAYGYMGVRFARILIFKSAQTATQQLGPPAKAYKSVKVAHQQRAESQYTPERRPTSKPPQRHVREELRLGPKVSKLRTGNAWPLAIIRELTDSLTYGPSSSPAKGQT